MAKGRITCAARDCLVMFKPTREGPGSDLCPTHWEKLKAAPGPKEGPVLLSARITDVKNRLEAVRSQAHAIRASLDTQEREVRILEEDLINLQNSAFVELLTPELIDVLVPVHGRTSCSDATPSNIDRCARCTLIDAMHVKRLDSSWKFEFRLEQRG